LSEENFYEFIEDEDSGLVVYEEPKDGINYIVSGDVAEGVEGGDYSAAHVGRRDKDQFVQVAQYRGHPAPFEFADILLGLSFWYNDSVLVPERNAAGVAVVERVKSYPRVYREQTIAHVTNVEQERVGWRTHTGNRSMMFDAGRKAILQGWAVLRSPVLINEALSIQYKVVETRGGGVSVRPVCPSGHDDCVMAWLIGLVVHMSTKNKPRGRIEGWVKRPKVILYDGFDEDPETDEVDALEGVLRW